MRILGRTRAVDPAVWAAVTAFLAVRVFQAVVSRPSTYPDSPTYRRKGSFLDFSLTSLDGHSVRPWGVTAWMALWPGDEVIVLAQLTLSFVAWSVLALTAAATVQRPAVRRVLVVVLLLLPATAQVSGWDLAVLGESVSASTGALAVAALMRLARSPSWPRAGLFVAAGLWFAMTRPNLLVVLLVWAVACGVLALAGRHTVLWGAVAAALVAISAYAYVYNIRSDAAWTSALGYSRTTVAYAYPVSDNGPVAEAILRDLRRSDAPRCMIPKEPYDVSAHGTTAWVVATVKTCPGMDAWATQHWNRWYADWLIHHFGKTMQIVGAELPNSLSPPVWTGVTAPAPDSVSALFFGSAAIPLAPRPADSYRTQPLPAWLAAAAALAVLARRRRRSAETASAPEGQPGHRVEGPAHRWPVEVALVATVVGGLAAAVSSGLLIQTMPFEVGQESVAATVALTAAAVLLVGLGADRLLAPGVAPSGTSSSRAGSDDDDVAADRG